MSGFVMKLAQFGSRLVGTQVAAQPRLVVRQSARAMSARASVTRVDISKAVAIEYDLSNKKADEIVAAVFDKIVSSVASGEKVAISGFGTFQRATRAARTGRNPRTGEALEIAEANVPRFSALKGFKDAVRGSE